MYKRQVQTILQGLSALVEGSADETEHQLRICHLNRHLFMAGQTDHCGTYIRARDEACLLYTSMCAGAIVQARIPRVVIGCMNPKAGCAGSVLDMLHEEGFNHQVQTDINVCREECSGMLSQFFKDLRKKRAEK